MVNPARIFLRLISSVRKGFGFPILGIFGNFGDFGNIS